MGMTLTGSRRGELQRADASWAEERRIKEMKEKEM